MNKFSKAQIRQIILRAKEDGQSMAQELSHLMRIEMPEIARPNLFGVEHCNDQHFTISQSWLGIAFLQPLACQKVFKHAEHRYHEPGNIHWGDLCDLCWFRNSTNTAVSFSCQGPKTCTSG